MLVQQSKHVCSWGYLDSHMYATRHSQQLDLYRSLTRLGKGGSTLRMAGECGIAARKLQGVKKASGFYGTNMSWVWSMIPLIHDRDSTAKGLATEVIKKGLKLILACSHLCYWQPLVHMSAFFGQNVDVQFCLPRFY